MTHRIIEKWNDKERWFRDHAQASRVGTIILERFADDRLQEECRYLSRLRWHLFMGYQEVSYDELQQHVSQTKMAILDNLFASIVDSDYDGIDQWTTQCEQALPIIADKWREQNAGSLEDEGLIQ
jgi:hypothetical protein